MEEERAEIEEVQKGDVQKKSYMMVLYKYIIIALGVSYYLSVGGRFIGSVWDRSGLQK